MKALDNTRCKIFRSDIWGFFIKPLKCHGTSNANSVRITLNTLQ